MDLLQLTYFSSVAENDSMNQAAEKLNVSQSTLSVSIKKLEEELNVKLFQKIGRKNRLTDAGQILLNGAKEILDSTYRLRCKMLQFEIKDSNVLNIVADYSQMALRSTELFSKCYPDIKVNLKRISQNEGVPCLINGQADIWFSHSDPENSLLYTECLLSDIMLICVNQDHRLAGYNKISIDKLNGETIVCSRKTNGKERYGKLLANAGVTVDKFFEVEDPESTLYFVAGGYGIGFSSRCIHNDSSRRELELPSIRYVEIDDSDFRSGAFLARLAGKSLNGAAKLYWDFMEWYGKFCWQNGTLPQENDYITHEFTAGLA